MESRLTPRQRKQNAFTLIELLVVIAIIAILAAILFPVFAQVREQARQSSTMSNMHSVYVGAKLYNEDEGHYPSVLFGYAEAAAPNQATLTPPRPPQMPALTNSGIVPMDQAKEYFATYQGAAQEGLNRGYLYGEQVKNFIDFTSADNLIKDKAKVVMAIYPLNSPYRAGQPVVWEDGTGTGPGGCPVTADRDLPQASYAGQQKLFYAMDSMDIGPALNKDGTIMHTASGDIQYELHYSPDWTRQLGTNCEPKDPANNNQIDVTQLKYKNPPTDRTVLTYVTSHVATANSSKVEVILLSGTARKMDVKDAARQLPLNYRP